MLKGSYKSLNDPHSVILSASTAEAIFGDEDPINQTLRLDNRLEVTVTGVAFLSISSMFFLLL
ncbi:ABC transporter permease [Cyclobacterium plantarum]|uniref:ABC transporter permease n=1 Tax=Cyclobacterium plantarum TaxID=2716263 RepID=UPI003F71F517